MSTPGLGEPHPFTIAGGEDGELRFSIKAAGDWFERLAMVRDLAATDSEQQVTVWVTSGGHA